MPHSDRQLKQSTEQQTCITITFLALSWFFILLRIWTRTCVISGFGWDDSVMILAGMTFTVFCATMLFLEANGGGTHVTGLPQLQMLVKWVVIGEASYILTVMIVKISLAIFFARIIVKRSHFIFVYVTVGVNIFSSTAAFFYCIFRCGNLDDYAINQLMNRCTPHWLDHFMAYQQAAFTTLTDLVFLVLPFPILWHANMDPRSKFSVGFILCLAALGCICSGIRFKYLDSLVQTIDFFWNIVNISIWSTIEAGACIVAGCLATLRPLMKCALLQARESSAISGCTQLSRNLRSAHRSNENSNNASLVQQSDVALSKMDHISYDTETKTAQPQFTTMPSYTDSCTTRPDSAVPPLTSDIGNQKRSSADPILKRTESDATDSPSWEKEERTKIRQAMRLSWKLHRIPTNEEFVHGRPSSEPVPPIRYKDVGQAV